MESAQQHTAIVDLATIIMTDSPQHHTTQMQSFMFAAEATTFLRSMTERRYQYLSAALAR